jgi:VIT1/CCC1 family predicted Fe2+/Mn2+ transporter
MRAAPTALEIRERLDRERRRMGRLGEIREAVFGAQDGLVSTLAVVSTVSGATSDRTAVLIAGIATGLAGIFSMAAGEFLSAKSQREVAIAKIADERERVALERRDVETQLAYMLEEEGLPDDEAAAVAATIGRHPEILLTTTVEKAFGMSLADDAGSPLQGALVMGVAFGLGTLAPLAPYLMLPMGLALAVSLLATGATLFGIGVVKTRWTAGNWLVSGLEILLVGAIAGVAGYLIGDVLPTLVGG